MAECSDLIAIYLKLSSSDCTQFSTSDQRYSTRSTIFFGSPVTLLDTNLERYTLAFIRYARSVFLDDFYLQ